MKSSAQLFVLFTTLMVLGFNISPVLANDVLVTDVGYQTGDSIELSDFSFGGALSGSENGKPLTSLAIHLVNAPYEAGVEYRVFTNGAWLPWSTDLELTTVGTNFAGLQVRLRNFPNAEIHYQTYRKELGWGSWVKDGATSGTLNSANAITGLRVKVFEVGVEYQSHLNGLRTRVFANNEVLGVGNLETLSLRLQNPLPGGKIVYRAHLKDLNWTNWVNNGSILGVLGSGKWIEAIEIYLENMPGYQVEYQVRTRGSEWSAVAYNGSLAGTTGLGLPIDAYRVRIVKTKYNAYSAQPEVEEPYEIGAQPNTTTLTYSAGPNAEVMSYYQSARTAANIPALTIDGVFDDGPGGVAIGIGDQFTVPNVVNYVEGDYLPVPSTFNDAGDNVVDDNQFEAFFGSYDSITKIFTVIYTPYDINECDLESDLGLATHTFILYDNDDDSNMILDGFVIPGIFFENSWGFEVIDGQNNMIYSYLNPWWCLN